MTAPRFPPVLVLNWNGWDDTMRCLSTLSTRTEAEEIWLIDNGSEEDHSALAAKALPGLNILRLGSNFGWAGGYNRALRIIRERGADYAYLLNNDTQAQPGFLSSALDAAVKDNRLAAVGSRIAYDGPMTSVKFDGEYHSLGTKALVTGCHVKRAGAVNGAGMLIRLSAFAEVGEFDERFFCYWEETEWCHRARAKGWDLAVSEASVVYHKCEGSDVGSNALYYRTRNQFLMRDVGAQPQSRASKMELLDALLYAAPFCWLREKPRNFFAVATGAVDGYMGVYGRRDATRLHTLTRSAVFVVLVLVSKLRRKLRVKLQEVCRWALTSLNLAGLHP